MKVIGLTGGIGSGKSTVALIFKQLGIPVYHADDRAKWLMQNDPIIVKNIVGIFGEEAFDSSSRLNNKFIGKVAFNKPELLEQLNKIVHPAVAKDFKTWVQKNQAPLLLKEAAIIFETGSDKLLDGIILVTAPEELRVKRVMKRSQLSADEVKSRMARQWPEKNMIDKADFVIVNDGTKMLIPQVMDVLDKIRNS